MNKQEAIDKIKRLSEYPGTYPCAIVRTPNVIGVIECMDEPQKVKVPLRVANWIEYSRDEGWGFLRGIQEMEGPMGNREVNIWFRNNSDKYAEAWSNDFEVEEVAEWVVRVKDMYFMNWGEDGTCPTFVIDDNPGAKLQAKPFIKSEGQALAVSLKGCIEKV